MKLCAIVANQSSRVGVVATVPDALYPLLCLRSTQIVIGELLAVFLAFGCFPNYFRGSSAVAFVGNLNVIHICVNGAARHIDTGVFTLALHRRLAKLRVEVWWEYVPSQSNLSDGGSRVGTACDMAAEANIPLRSIEFIMPPSCFPRSAPDEWDSWWHAPP